MVGRTVSRLVATLALCLCWAMPAVADDLDLPGVATDSDDFATSLSERHPAGGNDAERKQAETAFNAAFAKGDHDAAANALENRLGMEEASPSLWILLAREELARTRPDPVRALDAAWQAQEQAKDGSAKADAYAAVADALVAQHRPEQAGQALEWAVAIAPGDAGYRSRLAVLEGGGLRVRRVRVEADAEPPRACIGFNAPPSRRNDFHPEDWITLSPAPKDAAITREDDQICISGLPLAATTQATIRAGMPGQLGFRLAQAAEVPLVVGDRSTLLSFDNRMFLLPRGQAPRIVLASTNIAAVKIRIAYFSERTIEPWTLDHSLGKAMDEYVAQNLDDGTRIVWSGHATIPHYGRNQRQQTVLPLPTDAMTLPGLYAVAVVPDDGHRDEAGAVQPVLQTDLAPTVWRGADGLTVQLRGYSDARPRPGVHLRLLAHNNDILAETDTGADGFAHFARPLLAGSGPLAPSTIQGMAPLGGGGGTDFVSLDLDTAAFDLSGRGTGGLPQPGPVDGFVWLDRGIYRPGETMQVMALLRDPAGRPVSTPVRIRVRRPNAQVFFEGPAAATGDASAHLAVTLGNGAVSGLWTVELLTDPSLPPVGQTQFKVDAFVPDRMAVTLGALPAVLAPGATVPVPVAARFLYGAPAAGLVGSATLALDAADAAPALPGYRVGLVDEQFAPQAIRSILPATDQAGRTTLSLALASAPDSTHPVQAHLDVIVNDPSGHGARAHADLPVRANGPLIGIKPDFRDSVDDGAEAGFEVAAIDPDGRRIPLRAHLRLVREDPDWRLVLRDSLASYETVYHDTTVDSRDVSIPQSGTLHLARRLGFGRYRLEVEQAGGLAASSMRFYAGWSDSTDPDVPDAAAASTDRARYAAGQVAHVHVSAPFDGIATLLVLTDRVLSHREVSVAKSGSTFDVPVDPAWGPGAYVAVHAYRPGNGRDRPKRAIGLVWLPIDPAARHLKAAFAAPPVVRPGAVAHVRLHTAPGAWASVAAVDEGILRLTDFAAPDPAAHFLGRRRLGIDVRDDWGHLIAPASGEAALLAQGGDENGNDKPNIPQVILSLFQAPMRADSDGNLDVSLPMPDFSGQVRLMAVSWDGTRVGSASADMLVRDRLVATPLLPRFLAPGDEARIGLLLQNVELPAGRVGWRLGASGPVALEGADSGAVALAQGAQAIPTVLLRATGAGTATLRLDVDGPDGFHAHHEATLGLHSSRPRITVAAVTALGPGADASMPVPAADYLSGTWTASASFGGAVRYGAGGLLADLDVYPLFCLEQASSKGLPLTFVPAGTPDADRAARLQRLVGFVLDRQRYDGGFGLWNASDTAEPWLSAYATEFLLRARHAGAVVPDQALHDALHYQSDLLDGDDDTPEQRAREAYALYVLALGGEGRIGRARVLFEQIDHLPTPLSRAQLGAALAIGNDRPRADAAFAAAGDGRRDDWAYDYGDPLRDRAALVVLMSENGASPERLRALLAGLPGADLKPDQLDTQQEAWLAAAALAAGSGAAPVRISRDGAAVTPAALVTLPLPTPGPVRNLGDAAIWQAVSITGTPAQAPPASRSGMRISRRFLTLDGKPLDLDHLARDTEFVLLFEGRLDNNDRDHQVRLLQGLPAGWEIVARLGPGTMPEMNWLGTLTPTLALPASDDRYTAVMTLTREQPGFRLAIRLRAVTVGSFSLPGADLADMYQPGLFARQGGGTIVVQPPG